MADLTRAQRAALLWLKNRNGDGVFDRTGVLIAAGERAGVMRMTWNTLGDRGCVEFYANRKRLRVTSQGALINLNGINESECKEREEAHV